MRTTIEMAHKAAGDDWGLFQEYMPEIHRLVELVRADERARMAEHPAQQEPVPWSQALEDVWAEPDDTTPQPAQRKPLPYNKEDMKDLDVNQRLAFKLGWKAAEEAHNIKENT